MSERGRATITFIHGVNDDANGEILNWLEVDDVEVTRDGVWCNYIGNRMFIAHSFIAFIVFKDKNESH